MYKIVAAVNSMIEKSNLVSNVVRSETGELFFLYDGKFAWSMNKNDTTNNYSLVYYPGSQSPEQLVNVHPDIWAESDHYVVYRTSEIKTREASESFSELYTVLLGKLFNIDYVLDQIISTAA